MHIRKAGHSEVLYSVVSKNLNIHSYTESRSFIIGLNLNKIMFPFSQRLIAVSLGQVPGVADMHITITTLQQAVFVSAPS